MKNSAFCLLACIALLAAPLANAKESGEKGGTADINIGLGELNKSRPRPNNKLKVPARPRPRQPGATAAKPKPASRPSTTGGNPDRPVVPGSVPNPKSANPKPSNDTTLKGKKILQN